MDIENKYGTLAVQKHLLEILHQFDQLCRENGIVYSVMGGQSWEPLDTKGLSRGTMTLTSLWNERTT